MSAIWHWLLLAVPIVLVVGFVVFDLRREMKPPRNGLTRRILADAVDGQKAGVPPMPPAPSQKTKDS